MNTNKALITRTKNYLIRKGCTLDREATTTDSVYLRVDKARIRVSDHLPKEDDSCLISIICGRTEENDPSYSVILRGHLINFDSLASLRGFITPLIIDAMISKDNSPFLTGKVSKLKKELKRMSDIASKWQKKSEKYSQIIQELESKLAGKNRHVEELQDKLAQGKSTSAINTEGDGIMDGYGRVYNLKDFDAGQMLTIRKYIDTNRRKGRVGFL